jgi:hypothetical protein
MYSPRLYVPNMTLSIVFSLSEGVAEPLCSPHFAINDSHFLHGAQSGAIFDCHA